MAKKKKTQEEQEYNQLVSDIKTVMSTPAGQNFIWAILDECPLYGSTYGADIAFLEGKRTIGLRIIEMINAADPALYPKFLLERIKQEARNE